MWLVASVALGLIGVVLFTVDVAERGRLGSGKWSLVEVYNNNLGLRGWLGVAGLLAGALTLLGSGNG